MDPYLEAIGVGSCLAKGLVNDNGRGSVVGSSSIPEAPAILFLRSDLIFRSDLIVALAGKCEVRSTLKNKIGSLK